MQAVAATLIMAAHASAATARAGYTVHVPLALSVTGPAQQTITIDAADQGPRSTTSNWVVVCNDPDGAKVSLSVSDVFMHAANSGDRRDARLDLAVADSDREAGWSVTGAADQTDLKASDRTAAVQAASSAAGGATFRLTLTLVADDAPTPGDYTTTVTATVTGN